MCVAVEFGTEPDEMALSLYGRLTAESVRELAAVVRRAGRPVPALVLVDLSAIDPTALAGDDLHAPETTAPSGGCQALVRATAFVAATDGAQRAATLIRSYLGESAGPPRCVFASRDAAIEWLRQQRDEPAAV